MGKAPQSNHLLAVFTRPPAESTRVERCFVGQYDLRVESALDDPRRRCAIEDGELAEAGHWIPGIVAGVQRVPVEDHNLLQMNWQTQSCR